MNSGSWGIELWDQSDSLMKHSSDQISSNDTYYRLFSEVHKLQLEFGKRLRKVMISYLPKRPQNPDDLTYSSAHYNLIQTLSNMGGVFESHSKELMEQIVNSFRQLYENDRKDLDNQRGSLLRLSQSLEQARKQLDSSWQKYVMSYRDRQKAHENSIRADKDLHLPRIDQQKLREVYLRKQQTFDQVKAQYAFDLNTYNKYLRHHHNREMVEFLDDLSLKDRSRTERTKELLLKMISINETMFTQLSGCVQSMQQTVSTIDSVKDSDKVIERYKSGEFPPVDLPFLDLDACPSSLFEANPHAVGAFMLGLEPSQACGQLPDSNSINSSGAGMFSGLKRGTTKGSREDAASFRTPFVCDISVKSIKCTDFTIIQLTDRLRELAEQIKRTEAEAQGTKRLLEAYRNNPNLGSHEAVEPKEDMLNRRLNSLNEWVKQIQKQYDEVGGDQTLKEAQTRLIKIQSAYTDPTANKRESDAALAEFDSDDSFDSEPEAPVSTFVEPTVPANSTTKYVGYATAKYEYEGDGSTCLAAKPGDFFYVVEQDTSNTGWTSVVSMDGSRSGFVPTEFIEVTMY